MSVCHVDKRARSVNNCSHGLLYCFLPSIAFPLNGRCSLIHFTSPNAHTNAPGRLLQPNPTTLDHSSAGEPSNDAVQERRRPGSQDKPAKTRRLPTSQSRLIRNDGQEISKLAISSLLVLAARTTSVLGVASGVKSV